MFDDNEIIINRFTEDSVDEILRQGDIVLHDLIRHNLSHIKHKFKITQDGNQLEGCKAQINLNSGISKMFSCANGDGGQVGGVFKSNKKTK